MDLSRRDPQGLVINGLAWVGILTGAGLLVAALWHLREGGTMEQYGLRLGTVAVGLFLLVTMSALGGMAGPSDYARPAVHSRSRAFMLSSVRSEIDAASRRPLLPIVYAALATALLIGISLAVLAVW
jgi:hypothetical protein